MNINLAGGQVMPGVRLLGRNPHTMEQLSNNSSPVRSRERKRRHHRRRAKFLLVPTMVVNAVLAFAMLLGAINLWVGHRSASTFTALALVCRWAAKKIRMRRSMHRRLAAGYAQPSAEEVLEVIRDEGGRYALFLRGFESEHRNITYDGVNIEVGSREAEIYARPIETLLIEMLDKDVPLIALSNPLVSGPLEGAYRFEFIPTDWKQFVNEMLTDASLVVLHLTSLSGGILDELELLKNPSYSGKTVIIVGRNLAFESSSDGRWFQRMLHAFDHIVFQQSSSVWSPRQERQFQSRLLDCLQEIERANQNGKSVMRPGAMNFTLTTSYWPTKLWDFMKGPTLGSLCLLAVIYLFLFTYSARTIASVYDFLSLTGMIVLTWFALSVALGCLKGIDFILDYVFKAIMRPVDQFYYKVQNALNKRADSLRRSISNRFR